MQNKKNNHHICHLRLPGNNIKSINKGDIGTINIMKQLQHLLNHFIQKFHYFNGFFIANACKEYLIIIK